MIVTICEVYFLKSIISVFILVQFNTSLSKNYSYNGLCEGLNLRKKTGLAALSGSLCI